MAEIKRKKQGWERGRKKKRRKKEKERKKKGHE